MLFYPPWHSVSNEVTDTRNVLLHTENYRFTLACSSWKKQCPLQTKVDFIRSLFGIQRLRISEWTLLTKKLLSHAIVSVFPVHG